MGTPLDATTLYYTGHSGQHTPEPPDKCNPASAYTLLKTDSPSSVLTWVLKENKNDIKSHTTVWECNIRILIFNIILVNY